MDYRDELIENPEKGAERLVADFGNRLYEVARKLCLNESDAEDLEFRTLARAIEKISTFNGKSSLYTWLYSIMMNIRRMDLRSKGSHAWVLGEELSSLEDEGPDPGEAFAKEVEAGLLRRVVSELPENLRAVVVFRYFEDLSMNEIAKILDVPAGTVRFRLFAAKKIIRKKIIQTF